MESDDEDRRFAGEGGEALELEGDYDSEEEEVEEDEEEEAPPQRKPQAQPPTQASKAPAGAQKKAGGASPPRQDVKGQKVENQPFDLAVEVNDSEEIDSDEEEDEVHVGTTATAQ